MTQIKVCKSDYEANKWLQDNQDKTIIDIKFGYSVSAHGGEYDRFMIIYKEIKNEECITGKELLDIYVNTAANLVNI